MTRARLTLLIVVGVIVQMTLFAELRVADVAPNLPFLLAVSAGFHVGAERGARFGFLVGLLYDIVLPSPLGLAALAACVAAFFVGIVKEAMLEETWLMSHLLAAVASAAAVGLFAVVGEVFGQRGYVSSQLWLIMAVVGLTNLILSPLVRPVVRWSYGADDLLAGA